MRSSGRRGTGFTGPLSSPSGRQAERRSSATREHAGARSVRCRPPFRGERRRRSGGWTQFATVLIRAIISSTACGTGTFSLSTRFIALAHTFSLLSTVNL